MKPHAEPAPAAPLHSPEAEHRNHAYRSSVIPWYVHLIWIGFWIIAVIYIFTNLVPKLRVEVFNPP